MMATSPQEALEMIRFEQLNQVILQKFYMVGQAMISYTATTATIRFTVEMAMMNF